MLDWQKPDDYEYTKGLNDPEWAWEFLRRNPAYRKDFQRWRIALKAFEKKNGPMEMVLKKNRAALNKLRYYSPPRKAGESEREWYGRCIKENLDPWHQRLDLGLGRKWGISQLVDPDKREAGIKFLPGPYVLVTPSLEVLGENTELLRHREGVASSEEFAFVRVRLAAEVAPQLDRAKRELVRIQRIARREHDLKVVLTKHHKVKWQRYLRALDAHGVSASWAALGRVLFPKLSDEHPDFMARRSAERAYKQAMRISEGAYRSLIP